MPTSTAAEVSTRELTPDQLIAALTDRKMRPYALVIGDKAYPLYIRAVSWKNQMVYEQEREFQVRNSKQPGVAAARAELRYVYFGVVDKEGKPFFKTLDQVQRLEEADAATVGELIRAIKALSGFAPEMDWDVLLTEVRTRRVEDLYTGLEEIIRDLIPEDMRDSYHNKLGEVKAAVTALVGDAMEYAGHASVQKYKAGLLAEDMPPTDDELGNGSEQTSSDGESGRSASSNSTVSPVSSKVKNRGT